MNDVTTTRSVWEVLAQVPIGTVFAWGAVIIAVVSATVKGIMKLDGYFTKIRKLKEENEKLASMVKEHDQTLKQINSSLEEIKASLRDQKEFDLHIVRNEIITICHEALDAGEIIFEKHKSLEELFEEYTRKFHGNGYVADLVRRTHDIPIVGGPEK